MTITIVLLLTAVIAAIVFLKQSETSADARDDDWLPSELQEARLAYSEAQFYRAHPYPLVARVDRAYRLPTGKLVLVEFKSRRVFRVFPSDIVELSAQRNALAPRENVEAYAFVVIINGVDGTRRAIKVMLEDERQTEKRISRHVELLNEIREPSSTDKPAICRQCGHRASCSKSLC